MASSTSYNVAGTFTFTLPANIDVNTPITVTLKGAGGGGSSGGANGGAGGLVVGTVNISALTPGVSTFTVVVGSRGTDGGNGGSGAAGGSNGGGNSGAVSGGGGFIAGSGGGATDLRSGGTGLANRIAVAGGGGGGGVYNAGTFPNGGKGGAATGQAGTTATSGTTGGGGGTAAAGGSGSAGTGGGAAGVAGSSGQGGTGGAGSTFGNSGAGGGGGYFGGGGSGGAGGNDTGGGGGGSNYTTGLTSVTSNTQGGGGNGAGSAVLSYNLAPNQPTLTAHANGDDTAGVAVTATFSDPDAGDTQSRMDVRWRIGAGAWTTIAPAVTGAGATYTFAANTFQTAGVIGQSVEWQARSYDAAGMVGPWSNSGFVVPRREPTTTPTITVPAVNGSTVPVTVANTTQFRYARVTMTDVTAGTTTDFGWLDLGAEFTSAAFTLAAYAYVNGQQYKYRVYTADYIDVPVPSPVSTPDVTVTAALNSSLQPTCTVTPNATSGAVQVTATNPGSDPNAPTRNEIWRTDLDHGGVETRIASTVAVNGSFTDWQAPTNTNLRYRVAAIAPNGNRTYST